jgi:endonuclease YncB( thermonuclease family)
MSKAPESGWSTPAVVTRVIDGDTLEVEIRRTVRVRLLDCWSPESRTRNAAEKRRGLAAKAHLEQLAAGRPCQLQIPTAGDGQLLELITLGRFLGRVWIEGDDRSLSERQVEAGHATTNRSEPKGRRREAA